MIFDRQRMRESKRVHRERLASLPVGEKLRVLETLQERELAIRSHRMPSDGGRIVRGDSAVVQDALS